MRQFSEVARFSIYVLQVSGPNRGRVVVYPDNFLMVLLKVLGSRIGYVIKE
jgi:hypothetical protein